MSAAQNQAYFAEGLSEEILNLLAQSTTLRVTARTSSFSFKGRSVDIATIADRLKTTHVLEGGVRKSGNSCASPRSSWTAPTARTSGRRHTIGTVNDVFGVQAEIAAAVAESLQVTLTGNSTPPSSQRINAVAFERYLPAKYFYNRRGDSDVARAKGFRAGPRSRSRLRPRMGGTRGVYHIARHRGRRARCRRGVRPSTKH